MTLLAPWALLGLALLPLLLWWHRRRLALPRVDVPSLLFLVEEPGALLAARRRALDADLLLLLAGAALLVLAAAGPALAAAPAGRHVRVVISGGAPAAQAGYDERVEAALAALRAALAPEDRLEVLAVPGGAAGPRPSDDALISAARAGRPGLAVVLSDREGPTSDVRWVAVGEPTVSNTGIVAAARVPHARGERLFVNVLHDAPAAASVDLVQHDPVYADSRGHRERLELAPGELRALTLDPGHGGRVRLERAAGAGPDALAADDEVAIRGGQPLSVALEPGLPAAHGEAVLRAARAALGTERLRLVSSEQAVDLYVRATPPARRVLDDRLVLELAVLAPGASGVRAPAGDDVLGAGPWAADLSTRGLDLVYPSEPARDGLPGLVWRSAAGRVWPVLEAGPQGVVRVRVDVLAGSPAPESAPFWPLLIDNLVSQLRGGRIEGLLDPASSRLGRTRTGFDPAWLDAAPRAAAPDPVSLARWLALPGLLLLGLLWWREARRSRRGGYADGVPVSRVPAGALAALLGLGVAALAGCGGPSAPPPPRDPVQLAGDLATAGPERRDALARDLVASGEKARAAVPALLEHLKAGDADLRRHAARTLGRVGADGASAGEALIQALGDAEPAVRAAAARALGSLSPPAAGTIAALAEALEDEHADVRAAAVDALAEVAVADPDALPVLVPAVADVDSEVSSNARGQLCRLGVTCVPCLVDALKSKRTAVARCAALTLAQMGEPAGDARAPLEDLLVHGSGVLRSAAAVALGRLRSRGVASVPALLSALADTERAVVESAAKALAQIATASIDAVPPLLAALSDPRTTVRAGAAEALQGLELEPDMVLPALGPALADPEPQVRLAALGVLLSWPRGSHLAFERVVPLLEDPDPSVRADAVVALGRMSRSQEGVPALLALRLVDRDVDVRRATAQVLGHLAERAGEALPAALAATTDSDRHVRYFCLRLLAAFPDRIPAALERIVARLEDEHAPVRRQAVQLLGSAGAAAEPAVPALIARLADSDDDVREAAAVALGRLGAPLAAAAAPDLERLAGDRDQPLAVRKAARKAWDRLRSS